VDADRTADHTAERLAGAVDGELAARLRFVLEADALKRVERRSSITGGRRLENSAEHSWHLALMALVLAPYAAEPIDVGRVVTMVLVHDLVEIDAGDAFVYDDAARAATDAAERAAADRLFGLYPQGDALRACWEEFEANETADARFARALDRLQPLLLNHANRGEPWRRHGITADRVRAVNRVIDAASQDLWNAAQSLIDDAVAQGWLTEHAEPEEHA
jgi:putative hydrolase of HD superfamily